MSEKILTGEIVQENPRSYSAASVFFPLIVLAVLAVVMVAKNGNPFDKFAQPVTRPTQAQAIQQAVQVQASPTAPALATPTMQPTAAPEIRPTLEMGIVPTREIVPTLNIPELERQIELQAERDRQEAEALRVKLDIEKRRAEIGQAAAWGWFWLALAFSGLVIGLAVIVNMYARSIVANIKKAGELAKAEKTHVQPIHSPTQAQEVDNTSFYTCPSPWPVVAAWSEYIEETTQGAITREHEYYKIFADESSKTGFNNWRKFYAWLQNPANKFVEISEGQKVLTVNYYDWLKYWSSHPLPTD